MMAANSAKRCERMNPLNKRTELLPNVFLTSVQSEKFKTGCLSISFLRPLRAQEASANALIPTVLLRGCRSYPDIQSISAFLDECCGAGVGTLVRKKGEVQTTGFYADFLEDRFSLDGREILAPMIDFVAQLLLEPVLEEGRFVASFVEGEKQNLLNTIDSRINNKAGYALSQMLRTMCADETYGLPRLGRREDAEILEPKSLYDHYLHLLAHSRVEIFYHGSCPGERVAELLRSALKDLPRAEPDAFSTKVVLRADTVREVREQLDVTQGKLAMGLRLGTTAAEPEYPAALLMNTVFGSGVTSKLFANVREKMSLCYYANSSLEKFKGVMAISSGIEFDKFETARDEILRQLDLVRQGDITDEELETARQQLLSSLKTGMDSPARLDDYALGQTILGQEGTMADLAEQLRAVTKEQAAAAARAVTLDTVYFLEGVAK